MGATTTGPRQIGHSALAMGSTRRGAHSRAQKPFATPASCPLPSARAPRLRASAAAEGPLENASPPCARAAPIGMSEGASRVKGGVRRALLVGLPASADLLSGRACEAPGSGWSARSGARTNDLDAGVEWRRLGQVVDAVMDRLVRTVVPRGEVVRVGSSATEACLRRRWYAAWWIPATAGRAQSLRRLRHRGGGSPADRRARTQSRSERHAASRSARQRISPSRRP
jgi:hypothetical protein